MSRYYCFTEPSLKTTEINRGSRKEREGEREREREKERKREREDRQREIDKIDQGFSIVLLEWNPMETFHWFKEPLLNYLLVL